MSHPELEARDLISPGSWGCGSEALESCYPGRLVGARPEESLQEIREVKTSEGKKMRRDPPWKNPRRFNKTKLSMVYETLVLLKGYTCIKA